MENFSRPPRPRGMMRGGGGGRGGPPRGMPRPRGAPMGRGGPGYRGDGNSKPGGGGGKRNKVQEPTKQLFIRPVDLDVKPNDLKDYFKVFGEVRDVYIPRDFYTKEPKGVAYVEYIEIEDAEEAQGAMDGCEFNGKNISVTFAQSERKTKESMASNSYAIGMEIEAIKKEIAAEAECLKRIQAGEKVTPPWMTPKKKKKKKRSKSPKKKKRKKSE